MSNSKIAGLLLVVTGLIACSDAVGPNGQPTERVSLSIATSDHPGGAPFATADTIDQGGRRLVLTKVELVLRAIKLQRIERSIDCADDDSSGSGSADRDDCEKFVAGPLLLDLPLGSDPKRVVTVEVDTGTYRRVEFRVHKPEDDGDQADRDFLRAHPELERTSVRVTGTYEGRPFVYISDLNAKQKADLVPPLVVGTRGDTDLSLVVDVRRWFVDGSGALVDPLTGLKGQRNDNLVRDNIRRSFRLRSRSG